MSHETMGHKDAQTCLWGDRGLTMKENVLPRLDYIVTNIKRYAPPKKISANALRLH